MRSSSVACLITEQEYNGATEEGLAALFESLSFEPDVDYVALYEPSENLIEVTGWLAQLAPESEQLRLRNKERARIKQAIAQRARQQQIRECRAAFLRADIGNALNDVKQIVIRLLAIWRKLFNVPGGVDMTPHYRYLLEYFRSLLFQVNKC